jgi:membrane protein implicated in regulation of membrane protease activity
MFEFIGDHAFLFWVCIALCTGILEVSLPSFTFIFVSFASLAAASASLKFGWPTQAGVFSVFLLLSVVVLRPLWMSRKKRGASVHSRVEPLIGKVGLVTQSIDGQLGSGRVTVEGQDWAARSDEIILMDQPIIVESSDGIVLIVRKFN